MANNNFAYIEKTMPKVVDKVFAQESLTDALIGENYTKLEFLDAQTVKITKLATTGLSTYKRGGHGEKNKVGSAQSTHEKFTLSQERFSAIPLDKLDTLDDAETVLGALSSEFVRVHVVQELDAYRFSKLASYTNLTFGNRVEGVINEDEIIKAINDALLYMTDNKVPETNRIMYVSPKVMDLIRNTKELYKHLSQGEYKGDVSFTINKYENMPIVVVPSDEFYTDLITDDNGYHPSATSKAINFMIIDKKAPIIIKKLAWAHAYSSEEAKLDFVGYEFDNLYYHDLFVEENKQVAIYAHVSSVKAEASQLLVNAIKGAGSGNTIITNVLTKPAGIVFDKLVNITDGGVHNIGDGDTGAQVYLNKDFKPNASHNVIGAVYDGKIVALSKDFTNLLPTK